MAQKPNLVTELTLKTLNNVKNISPPLFSDFGKAVEKYQQAQQALAKAGAGLADTLYKIGASHSGDLGEGVRKLAEYVKESEARRDELSRLMLSDLITPMRQNGETEYREVMSFEKNYKKDRDQTRQEIMKLEAKTKKAGKKTSPEALKQQITELNDKIRDAEAMKTTKFRDVVVLERKKYASLLGVWNTIFAKEADIHSEQVNRLKINEPAWIAMASSSGQLPKEYEEMLQKQERTFVQIQQLPGQENYRISYAPNVLNTSMTNLSQYAGYDSYDSYSYGDTGGGYEQASYGYEYGYEQQQPPQSPSGARARALYDYIGEESTDLRLVAGDIIQIIQDDDGSGWTKGQNSQGRIGIFPTSYIEYM